MQSTNQISLYQKIDLELVKKANIQVKTPQFFYQTKEEYKEIMLDKDFHNVLLVNKYDEEWSPTEHALTVNQVFSVEYPNILFGEEGVTQDGNVIGLAAHIHSKSSGKQEKIEIDTIQNSNSIKKIYFEHTFQKDSLRGSIDIDFFMYVKEVSSCKFGQANQVGMKLSTEDIYGITIVVDGEGSSFPITEFEEKGGPLWILEKKWADAIDDSFDISNINLSMNVAHPLFEQVKGGKQKASRALMGDIMIQAMSMIIHQVIIVENNSFDMLDESETTSILAVVRYWVITYEIDISSSFTIMNSLRRKLENEMQGGGE